MKPHIVFRADANANIGTGHVMRCLSLAQAWQASGASATLLTTSEPTPLDNRLAAAQVCIDRAFLPVGTVADAEWTIEQATSLSASWLVVDGYEFGATYQKALHDAGLRTMVVDDYVHATHYHAHVVLNQNIHANETMYTQRDKHTRLLLGTTYAMLRTEFSATDQLHRPYSEPGCKVLITLGGGDPDNATMKVLEDLTGANIEGLDALILVGAANPHFEAIQRAASAARGSIRVLQGASNMRELMGWADVAICAGGTTCWELAFMGLPNIILILAENQRLIAEGLDEAGVAVNLGWFTDIPQGSIREALQSLLADNNRMASMSAKGQRLVDGKGCDRVIAALEGAM